MGLFSNLSFRKRSPLPESATSQPEPAAAAAAAPVVVPVREEAPVLPAASVTSAAARTEAEKLVQRVTQELPTFITVAVVEAATGHILAGKWAGHSGGALEVAVANAEIVRQTNMAIEALYLTDTEQLTDILITLRYQLHLLRVLPQSEWLLYLAVHTQDTNAALARSVMQMSDN